MNIKTSIVICLLIICSSVVVYPQANKKIDSLKQVVAHIKPGDKVTKAFELIALGQQYTNKSDYISAMDCYQQSLNIAQSINSDSLTANCYKHMAIIAFAQKNYNRDSVYDADALRIYKKINDKLGEGSVLRDIGSAYLRRGMPLQAKIYYDQALPIFKQLGEEQLVAGIYSNMATIYKDNYRKCIELHLAAKRIWDKYPGDDELISINTGNLGVAYFYMVRFGALKSIKPDSIIFADSVKDLKNSPEVYQAGYKNDGTEKRHWR